MSNEIVSVVVPIYNAEKYLEESVNSILKQIYENLQIILVNDGSTDNSWEICKELEKNDSRITAVTQKNGGVSVARNKGMDLASGDWIMFVDPDDILDKNIVTTLLKETNNNTDIVISSCYGFINDSKKRAHFFGKDRTFKNKKLDLYLQLLEDSYGQTGELFTAIGVPWGKLYRQDFLKKYNLKFDPKLRRMQDNIFNMYAFYYADEIKYIDQPLYYYRLENISSFGKRNKKSYEKIFKPVIEARYKGLDKLKLYSNSKIFQAYINEATSMFINIINSRILNNEKLSSKNIKTLIKEDTFKELSSKKGNKLIKSKKNRIKIQLIKLGVYPVVYKGMRKLKNE